LHGYGRSRLSCLQEGLLRLPRPGDRQMFGVMRLAIDAGDHRMMIVTKRIIGALVASSRRWRRRCGQQQLFLLILDKFLRIYLLDLFAVSLRFQKICEHIMICKGDMTAKSTVRYFVARNADLTGAFSVPAKWDANTFMPLRALEPHENCWDTLG
jgi:hypothetical protein